MYGLSEQEDLVDENTAIDKDAGAGFNADRWCLGLRQLALMLQWREGGAFSAWTRTVEYGQVEFRI
jgi:hypothetical protein